MTRVNRVASPRRQQGVALIVALLVLAIATGLAAAVMVRNQNALDATAAFENGARADQLANSAFILAKALLDRDDRNSDGPADLWAQPLANIPIDGATVSLNISDLQGRFNINNLLLPDGKVNLLGKERFARLLNLLNLSPDISNEIIGWIDPSRSLALGFTSAASRSGKMPAGQPMMSVTELRSLAGVTPAYYDKLAPYVTALPIGTPVNLNSASPLVMQAIGANAASLPVVTPGKTPPPNIGSVADFLARPGFAGAVTQPDGLSVNSQFFLCAVTVQFDQVLRHRYALIYRPQSGPSQVIALSNESCLTGYSCL
ncbi:type II secretion system minor pseudopilin GspK [Halothiobacillus sp.]|jgi:general secretion pathway protein K|uniref:type II secretion system minor pseudopilin GspK n=1 Tax=Halothiobacillus sp. TaxID=1891311 RepID=UPI002635A930|nr:type II secretion system minor pseudopilin GspK [Halothiobacillus sp.]MDD3576101.1 type II secretion system minor pseudopilin GspK [Halothiobacillus sp.]MDD4967455.1 type II secretion system minor pseudopilin GspK [Halothiobacillus sp.]MDY0147510.1 type II secretion system minor pseudopilin GspK [Halothiobacillus sp.]